MSAKTPSNLKTKTKSGFTLVELMLVVTIISILAAISLPNFVIFQQKAKIAEAKMFIDSSRRSMLDYYAHRGVWPKNNSQAGLPPDSVIRGRYLQVLKVDDGQIKACLDPKITEKNLLVLSPELDSQFPGAPVRWKLTYRSERPCQVP